MPTTLLLPPATRLSGALPEPLARRLGRADWLEPGKPGHRAQLLRQFDLLPRGWPVAALTRELDAGDAAGATWLRADPACVRADLTAVRQMACGSLGLDGDEADALLKPLKLLFGDAGFPISRTAPERWYLMLPPQSRLPAFVDPEEVLGDEIHDHLPDGPEGRRWRQLLSEAQVLLHNHPVNAGRLERGLPPVNSLWFWGGGTLPDHVRSPAAGVFTREVTLGALAARAGLEPGPVPAAPGPLPEASVLDLRALGDGVALSAWVEALAATKGGLVLDFQDGRRAMLLPRQRWRFWRRAWSAPRA